MAMSLRLDINKEKVQHTDLYGYMSTSTTVHLVLQRCQVCEYVFDMPKSPPNMGADLDGLMYISYANADFFRPQIRHPHLCVSAPPPHFGTRPPLLKRIVRDAIGHLLAAYGAQAKLP